MPVAARNTLDTQYVRDPFAIESIEVDQIVLELSEASPRDNPAPWVGRVPMTEYDHVVLANDRRTGSCVGILGARDGVTENEEEFIFLRTAFVAETARGKGLMRRMIAMMLLGAAGNGDMPKIVAARTTSRVCFHVMQSFAQQIPSVTIYPRPWVEPVNLRTAALAQRIARQVGRGIRFEAGTGALRGGLAAAGGALAPPPRSGDPAVENLFGGVLSPPDQILAILDFRAVSEEDVCDEARRIYRRN